MNWVGSRWWAFDFHTHTPASEDYGKGPTQSLCRQITPKEWLINFMQKGIDCVAVTDHNSGSWVDRLKVALEELEALPHPAYRPLYIFPGVELTVQGNIHILAIFAREKTTSDIDTLLGAVGYRGTKGQSDGCSVSSATEVIDAITNHGGLAIPAHVDQSNGLFTCYTGNTLDQVLDNKNVLAVEVVDPAIQKPTLYRSKNLTWAEVLGTDSHHPSGTGIQRYPGSHYTWVKMSKPSLDGLRLALVDGALSLRRSDQFKGDPNSHGRLAIENISVEDAKYVGTGHTFFCELNPWLNAIIGGRGTGKSTSCEFLRIALNRRAEIPKTLEKEFSKYSETSIRREDEGLLRENTKITVGFRKDGGRFRITWRCTDNTHTIEEETSSGNWTASEGDITQRFPVRIYSQKQIFELAKHPQALLQVVDDAPAVNHRHWKMEWDEQVSQYLSIRAQAREVQSGLQEEAVIRGQLLDIKRKLEVFENAGHAAILKAYQLRQNQNNLIDSWERSWEDSADRVRELSHKLLPCELDPESFVDGALEEQELLGAAKEIHTMFEAIRSEMSVIAQRITDAVNTWRQSRPHLRISSRTLEANQEYSSLLTQLSTEGAGDPSEYGVLVKQKQELEVRLKGFARKREILAEHQKTAEERLRKIYEHRAEITRRRETFLQHTLEANQFVQIQVIPYGDKVTIEDDFRSLIGRAHGGFDRVIGEVDGSGGLLAGLTQDTSKPIVERVESLKATLLNVYLDDPATVQAINDRRFVSHIKGLTPEQIDRMQCWFPADAIDIRYSLKEDDRFMPVRQGSPGQKTAALLAFILSYGDEPLVLDQPEDDLDNQLIYDLIVNQLRSIKQKRQVVVVTHNANIVVNGDAENVVALEISRGQTRIATQGGLQDAPIRDQICTVMEGGREAFAQRFRRIHL
jgi:hypothetical protein